VLLDRIHHISNNAQSLITQRTLSVVRAAIITEFVSRFYAHNTSEPPSVCCNLLYDALNVQLIQLTNIILSVKAGTL